jgi:hypothetical protein
LSAGALSGYTNMGKKRIAPVKVRVFEERYSGGVLDMNIFCLYIINENDKTIT